MKILLVSAVFMMVIAGLLALQIKTAYLYQTAQMIYQAEKQQLLDESSTTHRATSAKFKCSLLKSSTLSAVT